jgi:hypothetical protein
MTARSLLLARLHATICSVSLCHCQGGIRQWQEEWAGHPHGWRQRHDGQVRWVHLFGQVKVVRAAHCLAQLISCQANITPQAISTLHAINMYKSSVVFSIAVCVGCRMQCAVFLAAKYLAISRLRSAQRCVIRRRCFARNGQW